MLLQHVAHRQGLDVDRLQAAAQAAQRVQVRQVAEHRVHRNAEVDQAGQLIHAERLELGHERGAGFGGAKKAAGFEVALEGELGQLVEVFGREVVDVQPFGGSHRGKQTDSALEVVLQRLVHCLAHEGRVVGDEAVQHEGDTALPCVAMVAPGLAVDGNALRQLFDRLTQQVGQHAGTDLTRTAEGLGRPTRRDEDGQLGLHRARARQHVHRLAVTARQHTLFTAPQRTHGLDALEHQVVAVGVGLGRNGKVLGLPARCERNADTAFGEVVDQRPLFGHTHRVVQGQHHAAGSDLHVLGVHGQRTGGHCRAGVHATEDVEVALGRPHRVETVVVGELRAVEQQLVLLAALRLGVVAFVAGEIEEAEVHGRCLGATHRCRPRGVQHHLVAVAQRPQQLEHGDVERQARHRQPDARFGAETVVHAGEEVDDVAVLDHHPLGVAGGTRGIDQVGQIARLGALARAGGGLVGFGDRLDAQHFGAHAGDVAVGQHQAHVRVFGHVGDALCRVARVHRDVGTTGLEHGEHGNHHGGRTLGTHTHGHVRAHTLGDQQMRQAVGGGVELGVAERFTGEHQGWRIGGLLGLRFDQRLHGGVAVVIARGAVPIADETRALGFGDQRHRQQPLVSTGGDGAQHGVDLAEQALDGGGLEEVWVVLHTQLDAVALRRNRQHEIAVGGMRTHALRVGCLGALPQGAGHAFGQDQGMEQRRAGGSGHSGKREVTVLACSSHGALHAGQEVGHAAVGRHFDAQADQIGPLAAIFIARGGSAADPQVVLTAVAVGEQRSGGKHQGERLDRHGRAQLANRTPALRRNGMRCGLTQERRRRHARTIDRPFKRRGGGRHLLLPIGSLLGEIGWRHFLAVTMKLSITRANSPAERKVSTASVGVHTIGWPRTLNEVFSTIGTPDFTSKALSRS